MKGDLDTGPNDGLPTNSLIARPSTHRERDPRTPELRREAEAGEKGRIAHELGQVLPTSTRGRGGHGDKQETARIRMCRSHDRVSPLRASWVLQESE